MTEETPFRSVFTKKSNFLTQSFVTDPVNIQYGSSGKFLIPRHGDFITRLYALVDYTSSKSTKINQAHAMLDYVEIVIGGITVQRETGETLNMRLNLNTVEQQRFGVTQLYRMLGGGPGYPFTDSGQFPRPYRLAIPLDFWFHGNTELAFPLAALRWQEVEINIGFRNSKRWGGVESRVKGSDVRLQIEYGYVNEDVRKSLMKRTYLFPTEQFQYQQSSSYIGEKTLKFPPTVVEENTGSTFVNPVKALFLFYKGKETETDTVFDYSRGYKLSELTNSEGNDYLKTMEVNLDGEILLPEEVGTPIFLRGFQYYAHFPGSTQKIETAFDRYYSYIYALALCKDPMNRTMLNGGINFTTVKKPVITLDSKGNGEILKTTKVVSAGSGKTLIIPNSQNIEVGQYVRGTDILNDCRVKEVGPSGSVFYGSLNSSNVTVESNDLVGYCVPNASLTVGSLTTTVNTVYQGSGAKATVNYLSSTDMSITPTYSIPSVGDHITIKFQEFDRVVTEVYGDSVLNAKVLDVDTDNRLFFQGMSLVGMYTSDDRIVQNYNTTIDIVFGGFNDILGSTPFPADTKSFVLPDLISKPYLLNVLLPGTIIISDNVNGVKTIDRVDGTTVYLTGNFIDLTESVNTSLKLQITWATLNQNSTLSSGSIFTFNPRVVFNSPTAVEVSGAEAVFGNKIKLNNSLLENVDSNYTLSLSSSVVLDSNIISPELQFSRNIYFYESSAVVAKLFALSVNFIFIENGTLKLVYDNSEMALPRFI